MAQTTKQPSISATTDRYARASGAHLQQVQSLLRGLVAMRARLIAVKKRLHDIIEDGEGEETTENAYMDCCMRLGRVNQALGLAEALAQDGGIGDNHTWSGSVR